MEVSERQFDEMKHALGLNYKKKPYRNYFFINENDINWNDLIKKKLAVKELAVKGKRHINDDDHIYFRLTQKGVEFITGKKISDKRFKEL